MAEAPESNEPSTQPTGVRIVDSMLDPVDDGIERWLNDRLEHACSVGIRAGFTSLLGVRAIEQGLRSVLGRGGRVSVVLGGREQQTESAALAFLLALAREYSPEQVSLVMVSADAPMQNAKTYYVEDETGHVEAYVGSSNLTNGGLFSNTEAGVLFEGETSKALAARVREAHRAWESHASAMKITANIVVDYLRADDGKPSAAPEPFHLPRLFADGLEATLDVLELVSASGGQPSGVPTGFTDLDTMPLSVVGSGL
jgi:HKD family nuclease